MAREMKDSGIEWIGEMPAEWNVIAFWQAILRMGTGLNPRDNFQLTKTDPLYYVTIRNFKDGHLFLDDGCDRISKDAWEVIQERSDLQKGDILFASISKDGQAYILESDPVNWNINESVFCIRVNPEYFTEKYFYYHLINAGYYEDLRMDATGSTFQSIKQNKLRKSRMVLPPLSEQKRISDYLDHKCLEIDSVIADTKRTIEEYKALRQSFITKAITKGVRDGRIMKDSGSVWFGDIPADWNMVRLKYMFHIKKDIAGREGYTVLSITQKGIVPKNIASNEGQLAADYSNYQLVEPGDFAMNHMDLLTGCVDISKYDGVTSPDYRVFVLDDEANNKEYYLYMMQMCYFNRIFYGLGQGVSGMGRWRLQADKFLNFYIAVPPVEEQNEIVDTLKKQLTEMNALIAAREQLLTEMEAYKKSVIYEYVTGKKEVPACQ